MVLTHNLRRSSFTGTSMWHKSARYRDFRTMNNINRINRWFRKTKIVTGKKGLARDAKGLGSAEGKAVDRRFISLICRKIGEQDVQELRYDASTSYFHGA